MPTASAWPITPPRSQVLQALAAQYAPVASCQEQQLAADEVACCVMRPLAGLLIDHTAQPRPRFSTANRAAVSAALRPALALVIRSLGSANAAQNVAAVLLRPGGSFAATWRRFALLCAAVCDTEWSQDGTVTAAAAARCLHLLLDCAQWRCCSGDPAAGLAAAQCACIVAQQPHVYVAAARHLAATAAGAQPSTQLAAMVVSNVLRSAVLLVTLPTGAATTSAAGLWVAHVLCAAPLSAIPASLRQTLCAEPHAWLLAVLRWAEGPPPSATAQTLLPALANLCGLVAGPVASAALPSGRCVAVLQPSALLRDIDLASLYVAASLRCDGGLVSRLN